MIQVDLDPATKHFDPAFERKVREGKLACKEAAGWRCEWIYPNGKRCSASEGQLRRKKGRDGRPNGWSVTHMHGCHADQDRLNPHPRLICLCPRHHFEFDRNAELKDQVRQYRRGYQLTSTDSLIAHLMFTGISIWETQDGYHWTIDGTDLRATGPPRSTPLGRRSTSSKTYTHKCERTCLPPRKPSDTWRISSPPLKKERTFHANSTK